jgi:hypothetical protein
MMLCWVTDKPSIKISRWGLNFRVADKPLVIRMSKDG